MRTLSQDGLRSLLAEQTAHVWTFGVEIKKHANDPNNWTTEYYVANTVGISHGNIYYTPLPLEITMAVDTEDSVPQAKIRIDNVSRELSVLVRRTNYPPTLIVRLFRIDPAGDAHLEMETEYVLLSARVDAQVVEGTLGYRNDFLNEPAMHTRFTPAIAPALFQ